MNRFIHSKPASIAVGSLLLAALLTLLTLPPFTARSAYAAVTLPVLWTAGGLDAGSTGAGQAARIATDASGNVAVVSGPAFASQLSVTSYTSTGAFRWRGTVSPSSGTFLGDWIAAAPNGDFVAVGHNVNASGKPIAITMVRYASDGTLLWRVDLARTLPSVGRLLVDDAGSTYLAFNSIGDGQDIQLHKYDAAGNLLWADVIGTGLLANDIATSLTLSPDETEVALIGDTLGGAQWITALYNTSTGARQWLVIAPEGTSALDAVVDGGHVYVTGRGNVGINGFLTVVAYDRTSGARLWRSDKRPADGTDSAGLRMSKAPDGSLVVAGQALRGFLDWYTVAFETTGAVRWEAVRDGGLNTDEIPRAVLVLPDGTTVVTGRGGPNLPGGYIQGVTAGYGPNGTLLWEAFAGQETVWATSLPTGDVCATGGYDALITCWQLSSSPPTPTATSTLPPTATPTPTVTPPPVSNVLHVASITMSVVTTADNRSQAKAVVTIRDENGQPVGSAFVNGLFSGDSSSSGSGSTDSSGEAILTSSLVRNGASWTFCVTSVAKRGYSYNPDANVETCDGTGGGPTPTPTATPVAGATMHSGDLDGSAIAASPVRWNALVTVFVHGVDHSPVSDVTVSGSWSIGAGGPASCVTDGSGSCSLSRTGLRNTVASVTFTVTNATHGSLTYDPAANHDPDGDSNGTTITVSKP